MSRDDRPWRQYLCRACGLIYDEEVGDPDGGLAPGTRFEDIPDDWECPLCGVKKVDFELFEKPEIAVVEMSASHTETGIVIVGAGLAGWSVVEAIRRLDQTVPITLVSACDANLYHKPELSVAIGRGLTEADLVKESGINAARRLGVQLLAGTFAVGLSPSLHQLRTTRGTLTYTHLVLAQGAKPVLPKSLPPELCWRVNDLAGWSGLQKALAKGAQTVAIVGAGMIGCEMAEDVVRAGHQVILLDRHDTPLAGLLPEQASKRVADRFAALGIDYIGNDAITAVTQEGDQQKCLHLSSGETRVVDHVLVATGLATDNRLSRSAGLDFDRGIAVDANTLQTSEKDVYALGDCISIHGNPCRFVEPINKQAAAISHALLGRDDNVYEHTAPVVRLKIRSLPVVVHGLPSADIDWTLVQDDDDELLMEQRYENRVVAHLKVGTSQQRQAM